MGQGMELEFEKNCTSELSPNTVLPQRHCSSIEKRKPLRKDDNLLVNDSFTEISFHQYRSASCKNSQSRTVGLEDNIVHRRGSMYQSSREVRKMKRMGSNEGRMKIELSRASDSSFSFRIVDSLCSSYEENGKEKAPVASVKSNLKQSVVLKPCMQPCSSQGFIEFCPELEKREKLSGGTVGSELIENLKFRCEQVVGPLNDGNDLCERDASQTFHKSLSAKLEMPHSPSLSPDRDFSPRMSSKSRFSPIKKMFDPFMKSKSLRSPLGYVAQPGDVKATTGMANLGRNQTCKSLLRDFSHTTQKSNLDSQLLKKDAHHSAVVCSPVHLHGCLKMENKHGVPFYEFSLTCPEEVIVAKTWKANNAFNWVYTFHSVCSRKKSNASSGFGLSDGNKESSLLGQMQVSCYLCSELKEGGGFDNSMVTEFILYDIGHARKSASTKDPHDAFKSSDGPNSGLDDVSDATNLKHQREQAFRSRNFDFSSSYPLASADLLPDLEIAAIVIQLPFSKRESLKCKRGDTFNDKQHLNLLKLSTVEEQTKEVSHKECPEKVKVVIPTGHHALPSGEIRGPSSLLERWRLGGGCDCGGWDMACPLTVFGNPGIQFVDDQPLMDSEQPLQLFVQGAKENVPALTLRVIEEGEYAVDFHAQLSTLQAFSICVALLHGTGAPGNERERKPQLLHSNSLKVLIEEEVKFLIEAVTQDEENKKKVPKKIEDIQQQHSYVTKPPFSPIGRV